MEYTENIYALQSKRILKQQLQKVVSVEEPISKNHLFRKVLNTWGIQRVTNKLELYLTEIAKDAELVETRHQQVFYWSDAVLPANIQFYRDNSIEKRNIEDIAPEEIWVAIQEVLQQNISIEPEELIRYLVRLFGFAKVGKQIDATLKMYIDHYLNSDKLLMNNGRLRLI